MLASLVAISLCHRAQATQARERLVWLGLDASAGGCGIWATHFIAMLAYDSGQAGYDLGLTILSLLFAAAITGIGLYVALRDSSRWNAALGGAIVGCGIIAMHFTGMMVLELPGQIEWSRGLIAVSLVFGVVLAGLSIYIAAKRDDALHTLAATAAFAFAILIMHFTAMSAATVILDPTEIASGTVLSPDSLSLVIAGIAAFILGLCLIAALIDRRSQDMLGRQKVLLDTALENMSQGLCMFDAKGDIVLFNERYAK